MNPSNELIHRYATYQLQAERLQAAGQPVPPDLVQAMSFVESIARDFSPRDQAMLAEEVQLRRDAILAAEMRGTVREAVERQRAASVLVEALRNKAVQGVTRHMSADGKGLTERQFEQLRKTGRYEVPARTRVADEMQRDLREVGIEGDPEKMLAHYSHLYDNPRAMAKYLDETVGDDGIARAWYEREIGDLVIGRGLQQRREKNAKPEEFKSYTVDADQHDRRRADILHAAVVTGNGEAFVEDYSPETRREGTLRNQIAQAMEQHEGDPLDGIDGAQYQRLEQVAGGG